MDHTEHVRGAVFEAIQGGLGFARQHLLDGERVLDAESWIPSDLPSDERTRLLILLRSDRGLNDDEIEIHLGAPVDLRLKIAIAHGIVPGLALPAAGGPDYLDISVPERPVAGRNSQLSG